MCKRESECICWRYRVNVYVRERKMHMLEIENTV